MKENYDCRVEEWWPKKNRNLIGKLEDDAWVDDQSIAKSIIQMPCHLGSYILGHSKRLIKNVIRGRKGFYSNNSYYGDTDNAYNHKKNWFTLVDNGCVGKSLGLGKNDYGNASIFYLGC